MDILTINNDLMCLYFQQKQVNKVNFCMNKQMLALNRTSQG